MPKIEGKARFLPEIPPGTAGNLARSVGALYHRSKITHDAPGVLRPSVLTGKQDVRPAERRDMGKQFRRHVEAGVAALGDRMAEMHRIPVDDDDGEQIEPGYAIMLAFCSLVTDFTLTADAQRILQGVMRPCSG